jgi:hypothetical protein
MQLGCLTESREGINEMDGSNLPLSQAARRLGLSWAAAWRLVLERKLEAEQQPNGRWLVRAKSVEAYLREHPVLRTDGRRGGVVPETGK